MTNGRVILDTDFSALANASFWPHPDYKVVSAAYGATATVASGFGHLDTGNNGSYGGGVILQMRPQVVDQFEVEVRAKILTVAASGNCWLGITYRTTADWNFTTGANSGDTVGSTQQCWTFSMGNLGQNFSKRVNYSGSTYPDFLTSPGWSSGTIVRCRLRVTGDSHMARVWVESAGEPLVWHSGRIVDTSLPRKGYIAVGLGSENAHGLMDISRIVVREIGDPWAPVLGNFSRATFNGTGAQTAFTFSHGVDGTPSNVTIEPRSAAAAAAHYVSAVTATDITVTYSSAPASGTGNVMFDWRVEV